MNNTVQEILAELKQGGCLIDRMDGNIYLKPSAGAIRRISRTTLASLKQQGLIHRSQQASNPFVRTYELNTQTQHSIR